MAIVGAVVVKMAVVL